MMKKYFVSLGILQTFIAMSAIPAGILYLTDVSGSAMGNTPDLLKNSPFTNFLIPALFLLIVIGIGNSVAAFFSFTKKGITSKSAIALGGIMCLWIIIQVYWIGLSSFMQPLFFAIGVIEALLGFLILKFKFSE